MIRSTIRTLPIDDDDEFSAEDAVAVGPTMTPTALLAAGGATAAPRTNWNVATTTAGAPAISKTSQSKHSSPTLVQAKTPAGNHWLFFALVAALFYFEWRK